MKTAELFRKILKEYLDKQGHGSQARLADSIGEDRKNLNAFLNGRKMFSEFKRECIAGRLGYSYVDFLLLGKQMLAKEFNPESHQEKEVDFFPADQHCMYILEDVIGIFEESIATMFEPEMSIKLSAKIKAKTILNMYNSYLKRVNHSFVKPHPIDIKILTSAIALIENKYYGKDCDSELKSKEIAATYIIIMKDKQENKTNNQEDVDYILSTAQRVIKQRNEKESERFKRAA